MASIPICSTILVTLMVVFVTTQVVLSDDNTPMPPDKTQLGSWFNTHVGSLDKRKGTLDPALVAAEEGAKVVKVRQDGSGDFKTITDAVKSVPSGNTKRVILHIGPGNYEEKVTIQKTQPFITFYGQPGKMPNLTYAATAKNYGTVDSATLIVLSDYFVASNIIFSVCIQPFLTNHINLQNALTFFGFNFFLSLFVFLVYEFDMLKNSAPRPDLNTKGGQAVALRISGDKATFYNCQFYGFQDTLCDDANRHFFKDCLIQGTVDYIFGSGKSLYVVYKSPNLINV